MRKTLRYLPQLAALALALCPLASTALAQPASAAPPATETTRSLLDYYTDGGWTMHPILLCSIGTLAICVYCAIRMNPGKVIPKRQVNQLTTLLHNRDVTTAYELCEREPTTFSKVVAAALLKVNFERDLANKASMEAAAGDVLDDEETQYMQWVNALNIFATIAPMLGLLGTVLGMIESFDALAAGKTEPQDLANGIGVAMLTTAFGLIVGIPAMFLFFVYRSWLTTTMSQVQKKATFLIDLISGELQIADAATATAHHAAEAEAEAAAQV